MRVTPIIPPRTEEAAREAIKRLLQAAADMNVALDPQGFTLSWMADNSRTFIAEDGDKVCAFAHMVFGRRYHEAMFSASLIILAARDQEVRDAMLEFTRDAARMLGATVFLFEGSEQDALPSRAMPLRAHDIE